jgi:hypothetical protein
MYAPDFSDRLEIIEGTDDVAFFRGLHPCQWVYPHLYAVLVGL